MHELTKHLQEAIDLNECRLPLYAKLTNNESLPFSKKLINYEKLILKTSWILDRIGHKYQKNNVPFMKYEFVDISKAPSFSVSFPSGINYAQPIIILNDKNLFSELKKSIHSKSSKDIIDACNQLLNLLSYQVHVYNMLRHIVESIRRIAYLIPLHEELCKLKNIKPPSFYSYLLIRSHQFLLEIAKTFDEQVAFIQQNGVPFLWQDLPHIPLDNFKYK